MCVEAGGSQQAVHTLAMISDGRGSGGDCTIVRINDVAPITLFCPLTNILSAVIS